MEKKSGVERKKKLFLFFILGVLKYSNHTLFVVVFQSLTHVQFFVTPWTATCQASLSFTVSWSLLKLMSFEMAMPSNHLILCHHLLLPSVFPSIKVFSNGSAGLGCHSLPPGIFPIQGWNLDLLHCRQIPYRLRHWGSLYYFTYL